MQRPHVPWTGLGVAVAAAALDQVTKAVIRAEMPGQIGQPLPRVTVTGFFDVIHTMNPGVSFSLLHSFPAWALSAGSLLIIAVLVGWLAYNHRPLPVVGLGMIIGGAAGNVIDRIRLNGVTDFLDFHWPGCDLASCHFPAFNVADSAITLGVALLIIDGLFARGEGSKIAAGGGGPRPVGEKTETRSS